jgi:hypothetical protein
MGNPFPSNILSFQVDLSNAAEWSVIKLLSYTLSDPVQISQFRYIFECPSKSILWKLYPDGFIRILYRKSLLPLPLGLIIYNDLIHKVMYGLVLPTSMVIG